MTDSQSVSQYVLVSSTLVGLATRYYFLSDCCCLKFSVLYLWGALSDERTGSTICSVITEWSESLRTRNHILLSHRRSRSYFATDSHSVCLGIEHPCGTCDQILFPVGLLLSEICGLVSMGRPLWREDGSAICSVITQWSESLRTRNRTLLSHKHRMEYINQEQQKPSARVKINIKELHTHEAWHLYLRNFKRLLMSWIALLFSNDYLIAMQAGIRIEGKDL
jgi:hypothetical protein